MHLTTDSENSGFKKVFTPVNLLIWALFSAFLLFRYWSQVMATGAVTGVRNGVTVAVMISLFYIFWAFLNQWVLVMLAGLVRLSKPVGILCLLGYLYLISPAFLSRTGFFEVRFILAPMGGMIGAVIASLIVGLSVKDPDGRKGKSGDKKLAAAIDHLGQNPTDTPDSSDSATPADPTASAGKDSGGRKTDDRDPHLTRG